MAKCTYCDAPEFAPGNTEPLCEKHLELAIYISRLQKRGAPVTAESIQGYMARVKAPVTMTPDEVPALLAQMAVMA